MKEYIKEFCLNCKKYKKEEEKISKECDCTLDELLEINYFLENCSKKCNKIVNKNK